MLSGAFSLTVPVGWRWKECRTELSIETPDSEGLAIVTTGMRAEIGPEQLNGFLSRAFPGANAEAEAVPIAFGNWQGFRQDFRGKLFSVTYKYSVVIARAEGRFVLVLIRDRPVPFSKKRSQYDEMIRSLNIGATKTEEV